MYIHCTNIINTPEKFILIESLCAYILLEWIFYAQVSMLLIIFNVIQCVCSLTSKYVSTTKIISFSIAWKLRRILFWFPRLLFYPVLVGIGNVQNSFKSLNAKKNLFRTKLYSFIGINLYPWCYMTCWVCMQTLNFMETSQKTLAIFTFVQDNQKQRVTANNFDFRTYSESVQPLWPIRARTTNTSE